MPMLPSFAAETNAPDPNALAAGAAVSRRDICRSTRNCPAARADPDCCAAGIWRRPGPFQPTWESLASGYQVPEWFRDAKFGIWAHWGPQCQPEMGDWYAQKMYQFNSADYKFQCEHYGHPSKMGFKDVIHSGRPRTGIPHHLIPLQARGRKIFRRAGASP
jgi:hypothetical protein